ncbi:MAG TPA: hypothetical protein VGO37_10865 [Steroidobacteraceae bacterium]|jgi:hypothetical protein|nr:hypothetical protein [Steroidobacteraceae bacterium]
MAVKTRADHIRELTAKFIKLVESLEPGERLSIKRVAAPKIPKTIDKPNSVSGKQTRKNAKKASRKKQA